MNILFPHDEQVDLLLAALGAGLPLSLACGHSGLDFETMATGLNLARDSKRLQRSRENYQIPESLLRWVDLIVEIEAAKAENAMTVVGMAAKAKPLDFLESAHGFSKKHERDREREHVAKSDDKSLLETLDALGESEKRAILHYLTRKIDAI